jgi:hypothetical protein
MPSRYGEGYGHAHGRRHSPLFWLVVIGGLFWIFLITLDSIQKNQLTTTTQKAAEQVDIAAVQAPVTGYADQDRQAWIFLLANPDSGKINNPYSFQQHCGQPTMRVTRPLLCAVVLEREPGRDDHEVQAGNDQTGTRARRRLSRISGSGRFRRDQSAT